MLIILNTKKIVSALIILIVLGVVAIIFIGKGKFKTDEDTNDMIFDQSLFHLGKWNGQYKLKDGEDAIINLVAITTEKQARYLDERADFLHLDTEGLQTSQIKVHIGDSVTSEEKKFKLVNIEATFKVEDLSKYDGIIKKINIKENNDLLIEKEVGEIRFLKEDSTHTSPFSFDAYNLTYSNLKNITIEFINNTESPIEVNDISFENPDMDYEILDTLPIKLEANEKNEIEVLLKASDDSKYDFWIVTPIIKYNNNELTYFPSTYHYNYDISQKTIETIIKRDKK